jgi:hypothetical protein
MPQRERAAAHANQKEKIEMATIIVEDQSMQDFSDKLDKVQRVVTTLRQNKENLEWELDCTAVARDKALYWLLRLCEAAEREQWSLSAESHQLFEHAEDLLFEHNIFLNLPEPDHAILHLMEIVTVDLQEQTDEAEQEGR